MDFHVKLNSALLIFLVQFLVVSGDFITTPTNMAVTKGDDVIFTCQAESQDGTVRWGWSSYTNPSGFQILADNGTLQTSDSRYSVSFDSFSSSSILKLNNAGINDGGTILCHLLTTDLFAYAQLIVFESEPVCDASENLGEVVAGYSSLTITCKVTSYAGIGWFPIMDWTRLPNGDILSANDQLIRQEVTNTNTETIAKEHDGASYQIVTRFTDIQASYIPRGLDPTDHAINLPSYFKTNTIGPLRVHYPVSTITIQPQSSTYQAGDTITCITDGYPKASIIWFDSYRPTDIWNGETLPITSSMLGSKNWTCRASQIISYKGQVVDQPVNQKYFTFEVLPGGTANCGLTSYLNLHLLLSAMLIFLFSKLD